MAVSRPARAAEKPRTQAPPRMPVRYDLVVHVAAPVGPLAVGRLFPAAAQELTKLEVSCRHTYLHRYGHALSRNPTSNIASNNNCLNLGFTDPTENDTHYDPISG